MELEGKLVSDRENCQRKDTGRQKGARCVLEVKIDIAGMRTRRAIRR